MSKIFLLNIFLTAVIKISASDLVTKVCLGCLCDALSDCNLVLDCTELSCGPFLLTKEYYNLTNKALNTHFEDCAQDALCSGEVIQNYMEQFKKDCNGDGEINCRDFAALHISDNGECGEIKPYVEEKLNSCLNDFSCYEY